MSSEREFRSPFPDYDVLDKWDTPSWNDQTRQAVAERLRHVPERRFFDPDEWATLEAVCGRIVPQPDRPRNPVPIVPWIDRKLDRNEGDGFRYEGMPPMREVWRAGVRGIDDESCGRHGRRFRDLPADRQDDVLRRIQRGDVTSDVWKTLPPKRFFADALLRHVVSVYYAHPAAWSEIGFGGPASPRGYARLDFDRRDPWEAAEEKPDG